MIAAVNGSARNVIWPPKCVIVSELHSLTKSALRHSPFNILFFPMRDCASRVARGGKSCSFFGLSSRLELPAGDLLFPQPGLFLPRPFFLLGDFGQVVGGKLKFLYPQPVIGVGDGHVHGAAEPDDRVPGLLQARHRRFQRVGLHRPHGIIGLVVVRAEHQFGKFADHLGTVTS